MTAVHANRRLIDDGTCVARNDVMLNSLKKSLTKLSELFDAETQPRVACARNPFIEGEDQVIHDFRPYNKTCFDVPPNVAKSFPRSRPEPLGEAEILIEPP